jgi:hypothetical protein
MAKSAHILHHEKSRSHLLNYTEKMVDKQTPRVVRLAPSDHAKPLAGRAAEDAVHPATSGGTNCFPIQSGNVLI